MRRPSLRYRYVVVFIVVEGVVFAVDAQRQRVHRVRELLPPVRVLHQQGRHRVEQDTRLLLHRPDHSVDDYGVPVPGGSRRGGVMPRTGRLRRRRSSSAISNHFTSTASTLRRASD